MANEEKKRVEEQRKVLGEKGLKEKSDTLEKAIEENEVMLLELDSRILF